MGNVRATGVAGQLSAGSLVMATSLATEGETLFSLADSREYMLQSMVPVLLAAIVAGLLSPGGAVWCSKN